MAIKRWKLEPELLTPSHPITFLVMFLAIKNHLKMLKTDSYQIRLTPMLKLTKKSHH